MNIAIQAKSDSVFRIEVTDEKGDLIFEGMVNTSHPDWEKGLRTQLVKWSARKKAERATDASSVASQIRQAILNFYQGA